MGRTTPRDSSLKTRGLSLAPGAEVFLKGFRYQGEVNVVEVWGEGTPRPLRIITDLSPGRLSPSTAKGTAIEEGLRDFKGLLSFGLERLMNKTHIP